MDSSNTGTDNVFDYDPLNPFHKDLLLFMEQGRRNNNTSNPPDPPTLPGQTTNNTGADPGTIGMSRGAIINNVYINNNSSPNKNQSSPNQLSKNNVYLFLQNMHKSSTVSHELRELSSHYSKHRYIMFLTEIPLGKRFGAGSKRPTGLPYSNNTFYVSSNKDARACIVASSNEQMDLMPQFSSGDVVSVLWNVQPHNKHKGKQGNKRATPPNSGANNTTNSKTRPAIGRNQLRNRSLMQQEPSTRRPSASVRDPLNISDTVVSGDDRHGKGNLSTPIPPPAAEFHGYNLRKGRKPTPMGQSNGQSGPNRRLSERDAASMTSVGTGDTQCDRDPSPDFLARVRTPTARASATEPGLEANITGSTEDLLLSDDDDSLPDLDVRPDPQPHDEVSGNIIICCVYWDRQNKNQIPEKLTQLLAHAEETGTPLIICGDMNAHSEFWGCQKSDSRGEVLEDLILENDLSVLNQGSRPTYERSKVGTIIDVCMVSSGISPNFGNWRVSNTSTFSDHSRIDFEMQLGNPPKKFGRNLKKADWGTFRDLVKDRLKNIQSPTEWNRTTIEGEVSLLESAIIAGLDMVAPLKPRYPYTKPTSKNPDVLKAIELCKRIKNKKGHQPWDPILHKMYRAACNRKRAAVRKANTNDWRSKLAEIPDPNGAAKLMRAIKKNDFVPPTLLKNNGKYTHSKEDTIQLLMDTHFPGSVDTESRHEDFINDIVDGIDKPKVIKPIPWINYRRVCKAMASFSDFKACGPDDIKPIILKRLPEEAVHRLVDIYTASITLAYTPRAWRASRTVFIPKPGKTDFTIPKSFRPISLTSFCFKTLERLVLWHMEQTTFRRKDFHPRQHAFRKGHSTELALSQVVDKIESAIYDQKLAVAVFLDIEGAFDNLDTAAAVKAMKGHGVEPTVVKWYSHYLKNRTSHVQYGHKTNERLLTRGTPQGGVLSPILWNFAFDSLLALFGKGDDVSPKRNKVEIYGYADDACLITTGRTIGTTLLMMQRAIDRAVKWGKNKGLNFSSTKTQAMILHNRQKFEYPGTPLLINGSDIPFVEEVRYLGVFLDQKLTWRPHIEKKVASAKALLFKMKNALGISWGPKPHLVRWIYTGVVRPAITYGSLVWQHAAQNRTQTNKLKRLHAIILRMLAPKRKSTPGIAGMEMIAYLPPIPLFMKGEAVKAFIRNQDNLSQAWSGVSRSKSKFGHLLALQELTNDLNIPELTWDRDTHKLNFEQCFEVQEDSFEKGENIIFPSTLMCYTDGSRQTVNDNIGVGAGYCTYKVDKNSQCSPHSKGCFKLKEYNTVFQAEVAAIDQLARSLLRETGELPKTTYIFSDCKSALQALKRHYVSSIALKQCLKSLNDLASYTSVKLRWIKAHVGHRGNEQADQIAKIGATAQYPYHVDHGVVELFNVPAPYSYLAHIVEKGVEDLWTHEWMSAKKPDGRPVYRQTKYFFPKPDKRKSYVLLRKDRQTLNKVIQFTTGHAHMNRHQHLVDNGQDGDDPGGTTQTCRLCSQGEETPIHLVMECTAVRPSSYRFFGTQPDRPDAPNFHVRWFATKLLTFLELTEISEILQPRKANQIREQSQS